MKPEPALNFRRSCLLVRNDLFMNRFLLGIFAATTVALMALIYFLGAANSKNSLPDVIFWVIGLYFFGWLVADRMFSNIHDGQKNLTWHMLPASLTEKYITRLIVSTVGVVVVWTLFFWGVSFTSGLSTQLLYGRGHEVLTVLDRALFRAGYQFLVFQSVLMFGVIYFKKNASMKTAFTFLVYVIFLILMCVLIFWILFGDYAGGFFLGGMKASIGNVEISNSTRINELESFFMRPTVTRMVAAADFIKDFLLWYLLMPFFWIMGYLRLKELEV